jgi:hypothetical protein
MDVRESAYNMGLGVAIKNGIEQVLGQYGRAIVFEDDVECAPGMYCYMKRMLDQFADNERVMSISGYTHPRLLPPNHRGHPYCDGRFVCWGWGTWQRAWTGMKVPAIVLVLACLLRGRNPYKYGRDIVSAAFHERQRSLWAARFELLHILHGAYSVHPPVSLTNHMGFDDSTTSKGAADPWQIRDFWKCAANDETVPEVAEDFRILEIYRSVYGGAPKMSELIRDVRHCIWRWKSRKSEN